VCTAARPQVEDGVECSVSARHDQVDSVLFVASEMEARGTNEYIVHMAGELKERGVSVRVFCAPGPMLAVLEGEGIELETFERLGRLGFKRSERKRLMDMIVALAPTVVHAQTVRVARLLTSMSAQARIPVVLTVHTPPDRGRAFRSLAAGLAGIIATTQDVREELVNRLGVEKSMIEVIPNGIDVEALATKRIRPAFSGAFPVVGSVGPVEQARGHELFVMAAAQLAQAHESVRFVVAGMGSGLPKVRRLAEDRRLDGRMTFAADFSSYDEVLGALDVVVQSAQVDVSGFSILDAMGHGRPVVAFNTGTACEIIEDGKTGILVPREDVSSLARAIERLIDDTERARRMGEEARRAVAEKFNIKNVADRTLAFYASRLSA